MDESNSRSRLGEIIKTARSRRSLDRGQLSDKAHINVRVIIEIEHGDFRKVQREMLLRVLRVVEPPPRDFEVAGRIMKKLFPRPRVKFHLNCSVLKYRRR
jgi:transcriptional regulator with XRE-family HTH domain